MTKSEEYYIKKGNKPKGNKNCAVCNKELEHHEISLNLSKSPCKNKLKG